MNQDVARKNRKVMMILGGVVVTMGALAWAAVPFYDWFCRVTGYGGTTSVASANESGVMDQTILVRFDANTDPGMPWEFKPTERQVNIRIGETGLTFYEAFNPTDRVIAGTASFNVAPETAGYYFTKLDCFCFTQQILKPGERVEMPVTYFIDPEILTDPDAAKIHTITLSYTFYETEAPKDELSRLVIEGETGQTTTSN